MTPDPKGAESNIRELVENLVQVCTARARDLGWCVMAWPEECDKKQALLGDIEHLLKIAERAQKILTQMRKDEGGGACMNSCETFAAAMLEASEKTDREPDAQGDPQ